MPLTVLFPAIALVLTFIGLLAGFWLGCRFRTPAPGNRPEHASPTSERQPPIGPGLPAVPEAAMPERRPEQRFRPEAPLANLAADSKVMIVDDEPINVKVAQKYLKLAGYQHVIGITDSRTVIRRISEEQPDVVVLDIMMPEVSGLQILEQIRADGQWAYLPVIVVTASDSEETKCRALELGATDFLGKPVNSTELVPRVRNALLVKANHDYLKHYARELERQTRQLESQIAQARTDALTGLANRRALDEELQRRLSECQRTGSPLSVMLLDVDHFKDFNDAHGHRAGDEALRVLATALRKAMRQMDVVTRYGGEEFLVILPSTAIGHATLVAERTRQDICQTVFRYDGKDFSLTVSIGVAQLTSNEHVTRMLDRVDQAMYASKAAGRNKTYWHDGRATHPAIEASVLQQSPGDSGRQSRELPSQQKTATPSPPASCLPPLSSATPTPASLESVDPMGFQYDRSAFLWLVRQRIAEWKRGGFAFCVLLVQVEQDEHAAETQLQGTSDGLRRRITQILNAVLREMDLIGQYDKACFGVLLPRTTLKEGSIVAQRLRQSVDLRDPSFHVSPEPFAVTVAFAEVTEGDDVVRLLQRAETAMSAAGENRIGYHNGQWPEVVETVAQPQPLGPPAAPGIIGVGDAVPTT
jgi:diguanylate cyclase (GGDEF)-like protein